MACNTYQGNDPEFHERYGSNDPDVLAEMLCAVISIFDDNLGHENLPEDIQVWWNKHKQWDAKRK